MEKLSELNSPSVVETGATEEQYSSEELDLFSVQDLKPPSNIHNRSSVKKPAFNPNCIVEQNQKALWTERSQRKQEIIREKRGILKIVIEDHTNKGKNISSIDLSGATEPTDTPKKLENLEKEISDLKKLIQAMAVNNDTKDSSKKQGAKPKPAMKKCWNCGKTGHVQKQCWGKKNSKNKEYVRKN